MIKEAIDKINHELAKLFVNVPGVKIHGLAQTMLRRQGSEMEFIPALVDHSGEGKYIGIDDVSPVILYHKNNSIASAIDRTKGYGNSAGMIVNTYNNTLIIYLNRKRLKILPDELFLRIQNVMPESVGEDPFYSVVKITNVILSSTQVWASEYQKDFTLPPEANLFAVNYTIESSYKKGCFATCIEV